jgi:uncharacterized protein (TIGR02246 family)
MTGSSDRDEIRALIGRINDAWLKGPPESVESVVKECFTEGMVIVGPNLQVAGRGREACAKSYADFARAAKVRECRLADPDVEVSGDTAVATYAWEMTYEMQGREHHESGHDLYVLSRTDGRWRAVWRAVLMSNPRAGQA